MKLPITRANLQPNTGCPNTANWSKRLSPNQTLLQFGGVRFGAPCPQLIPSALLWGKEHLFITSSLVLPCHVKPGQAPRLVGSIQLCLHNVWVEILKFPFMCSMGLQDPKVATSTVMAAGRGSQGIEMAAEHLPPPSSPSHLPALSRTTKCPWFHPGACCAPSPRQLSVLHPMVDPADGICQK